MKKIIACLLFVVGVIHLLPLAGVVGPEKLTALYGIPFNEPNLAILMRHRAILFGLLGLFLCYAAFRSVLQPLALIGGSVSVMSFLWLAWATGGYNTLLERVVIADVAALLCLIVAGGMYGWNRIKERALPDADARLRQAA